MPTVGSPGPAPTSRTRLPAGTSAPTISASLVQAGSFTAVRAHAFVSEEISASRWTQTHAPCHAAALSHAAPKILAYILASICWACAPERARRKRTEGIARAVQRAIEKKQRETVCYLLCACR